jgi:hypothetical protein
MTTTSPAWKDVPANIDNYGQFKAMQYLGIINHLILLNKIFRILLQQN